MKTDLSVDTNNWWMECLLPFLLKKTKGLKQNTVKRNHYEEKYYVEDSWVGKDGLTQTKTLFHLT